MLKAFGSGMLAAALGVVALAATMWTLAPTAVPQSEVYAKTAEIGLAEHAAWIAHLKVHAAQVEAADAGWGLHIGS